MKSRLVLLIPLAISACAAGCATTGGADAVRLTFDAYHQALQEKDGERAARLVSQKTLDYFEGILKLALSAGADEVKKLSFIDRMGVVGVRALHSREELGKMTALSLVSQNIKQGWLARDQKTGLSLGEVRIEGKRASGELLHQGQKTGEEFDFVQEAGGWRIDFLALITQAGNEVAQALKERGMDENQAILQSVGAAYGRELTDSIWDPPR